MAHAASVATTGAPAAAGDELAAFHAEISAIEAEQEAAQAAADPADAAGAGPPTPDELEFEDDDGTLYRWDTTLRKYVPAGAGAASGGGTAPGYAPEDMVFVGDEEAETRPVLTPRESTTSGAGETNGGAPAGKEDSVKEERKVCVRRGIAAHAAECPDGMDATRAATHARPEPHD